ncbi:hypothetical protein HDV01_004448, partial [Terramyces sp. JEL0728]
MTSLFQDTEGLYNTYIGNNTVTVGDGYENHESIPKQFTVLTQRNGTVYVPAALDYDPSFYREYFNDDFYSFNLYKLFYKNSVSWIYSGTRMAEHFSLNGNCQFSTAKIFGNLAKNGSKTDMDVSNTMKQYMQEGVVRLSSLNATGINGIFSGLAGSGGSYGIFYNGTYLITNTTLQAQYGLFFNNLTLYSLQFKGVKDFQFANQTSSTANSSTEYYVTFTAENTATLLDLDVYDRFNFIDSTAQVNFNGNGGYVFELSQLPPPSHNFFQSDLFKILIGCFAFVLIVI